MSLFIKQENPYFVSCNQDRMNNNTINIKFERYMYTTSIIIEFRQQTDQTSMNLAKLHRDVFAEKLLIDSITHTNLLQNNDDGKINLSLFKANKMWM